MANSSLASDPFVATTPIALNHTNSGAVTFRWFVQKTEYNPAAATFRPLVNGEEAFGHVYEQISKARYSIDIICWGFQPSMMFKRDGQGVGIGELLRQKGEAGVKVRLLVWRDPAFVSELSENNMPGNDIATDVKQRLPDSAYETFSMMSRDYQTDQQRKIDEEWYRRANLHNVTLSLPAGPRDVYIAAKGALYQKEAFKNIDFATRGFSAVNRAEIAWHTFWHGKDRDRDVLTRAQNSASMGLAEPTHHQKMVLVDYEDPENARGFVMGHNMLDQYWDTNDHSYVRKTPTTGRNGLSPWQDISAWVTGPVLRYLNENFCQAWDDATGQGLAEKRKGLHTRLKVRIDPGGDTRVMSQILRTQSQKGKRDIEKLYLQAVNNATQHVFIENQYFRWVPLAERIKAVAVQQQKWGRDSGKHGMVYLFVITNSTDAAVGTGTLTTYRMLDALGQAKSMPGVGAILQESDRQSDLRKQFADVVSKQQDAGQEYLGALQMQGMANTPATTQAVAQAKQKVDQVKAQRAGIESQMKGPAHPVMNRDYPGLKVHVCTLVAPDSPPGKWEPVYVHAKLMTIDDTFTTIGSANINTRSMEADSELNICHEHGDVTKRLRQQLWNLHTGGRGAQDDPQAAFKNWELLINNNADFQKAGDQSPAASLVGFMRTSNKITRSD
ncbi:phospholipase D-like domain-containing protein [Burkholderia ambifaria]|uniref:phospholipase D-like domain-containing protein n=1 Tax=Burkholderia ambifaria TaxID=152480 RepID=UPI00158C1269|nr:phosphatidylserine/phosphatidylglycerophosphate/cardiolipin synthase family protein [Burkholderia ambifaria]